jgi:predicted esterase
MEKINNVLAVINGPHQGADLYTLGQASKKGLILLHGRGGSALDIASLYEALHTRVYTLIPEAVTNSWYPERFIQPQADNQPALDSALAVITALLTHLDTLGIKKADTVIAGFSQGACLAAEYLKRYPARYGGAVLMSGGFIGSEAEASETVSRDSLAGTPVYIGCDSEDFHIPLTRVEMTAEGLRQAGAEVGLEVFSDYGHQPHISALQYLEGLLRS